MVKTGHIILGVIIVIAAVLAVGYFKMTGSPTVDAFLNIYTGEVRIDHGKGWLGAEDGMQLGIKDKVKTMQGSEAAVVLHESVIINMDPETEILIKELAKEHVNLEQAEGSTWNKFTGLAGVEGLSIETPTTVATVRGTAFGIKLDSVFVGEGKVEVKYRDQTMVIEAGEKVLVKDGKLVRMVLTEEEREYIIGKIQKTIQTLKVIRLREVEKHPILARQLKKQYGLTDEEIEANLEAADRGEYNLDELVKKSPVKMESLYKIKDITEQIIEQNKLLEQLKNQ